MVSIALNSGNKIYYVINVWKNSLSIVDREYYFNIIFIREIRKLNMKKLNILYFSNNIALVF
jgi:hypothetical protein